MLSVDREEHVICFPKSLESIQRATFTRKYFLIKMGVLVEMHFLIASRLHKRVAPRKVGFVLLRAIVLGAAFLN